MVHRIFQRWQSFLLVMLVTALLWIGIAPVLKAEVTAPQLVQQGRSAYERGEFERAFQFWQQATAAYQRVGDRVGSTGSLLNQSQALQQMGLYRQSCKVLAGAVLRKTDKTEPAEICDPNNRVDVSLADLPENNLLAAEAQLKLGEILRLVGNLEQARSIFQKGTGTEAMWLGLGNVARDLGNRDRDRKDEIKMPESFPAPNCSAAATEAIDYYLQAIGCYQQAIKQAPHSPAAMQARLNSLSLQIDVVQWFRTAEQLPKATPWIAQMRSSLPDLISSLQDTIDSLPPTYEGITTRINFARSLAELSQISDFPSRFEQSGSLLATAVQQARTLKNRQAESYAIGNLGWLYEQIGKCKLAGQTAQCNIYELTKLWKAAEKFTRPAIQLAESIRASDLLYEWQWQQGRILVQQGNLKAATQAYEGSIEALKLTRQNLTAVNSDAQFSLRDTVEPLYREYASLLLRGEPDQPNLRKAINLIDALQLAELENFFRCNLLEAQSVKVEEVKDPTAAVFYTIALPDRLEVILKLPQQEDLKHYTTPIRFHALTEQLQDLRKGLEKNERELAAETQDLAQAMYNRLIRSAEPALKANNIKTLVFVLDGNLRSIPVSALHDGQAYLIEHYAVAVTPGLRILGPKRSVQRPLGALVAGFSDANTVTVQGQTFQFKPLTNVGTEVQQIRSAVKQSEMMLNQEFTTERFRDRVQELAYPLVHIATHGHFSSDPDKTFILTASQTPVNVNELQTVLQRRGQRQPNPIELLVLSACETAKGDRRATLGLAGVAIRAGAFGTMASLWAVSDDSTAKLMQAFYQTLQQNPGIRKAEALQQAQKLLLHSSQNAPYYWAPFVLVGNWL